MDKNKITITKCDSALNENLQNDLIEEIQCHYNIGTIIEENCESVKYTENSMNDILKYQYILMKIFGISFFKDQHFLITIYSIVCTIINLINSIRFFWNYKFFHGQEFKIYSWNMLEIELHLVFILSFILSIFMFHIQRSENKINKLNKELDNMLKRRGFIDQSTIASIKKKSFYVFAIQILIVICIVAFFLIDFIISGKLHPFIDRLLAPFSFQDWAKDSIILRLLSIIFYFPSIWSLYSSLTLYCNYCITMSNLYVDFDRKILKISKIIKFVSNKKTKNEDWNSAIKNLQDMEVLINENGFDTIYDWFFRLISISKLLNDVFNGFTMLVLLFLIPICCIVLFFLVDLKSSCNDTYNLILFGIGFLCCLT